MTHSTTRLILGFLSVLFLQEARAQIISDWNSQERGVVTYMGENLIEDDTYAAKGIFSDWGSVLDDFESQSGDSGEIDKMVSSYRLLESGQYVEVKMGGNTVRVPRVLDENGTDLFMLTSDGISIYLALDAPAYMQIPDDDIIRWVRYYAYSHRKNTERIFRRYREWEAVVKETFAARGVPPELAELCLVESGCTYTAVSRVGATGMWQFMPGTARNFGLRVDEYRDDRLDPVKSTIAAAKLLEANHRKTGEWTLAAAAYNCGAGRLTRGVQWNDQKGRLPKETQQYIPCLIAIHYVWTYRLQLGFNI